VRLIAGDLALEVGEQVEQKADQAKRGLGAISLVASKNSDIMSKSAKLLESFLGGFWAQLS
jgi:hypothetical protein